MEARQFALLAAAIFGIVAIVQLIRALSGWPVLIDEVLIPVWVSWIACVVAAILAGLGFAAALR